MITGRPTLYTEKLLEKAREYLDIKRPTEDEVIPTIEGLALYLKLNRSTIYDWISQEDKKEFSNIVEEVLIKQSKGLIFGGLTGKFNSSIAKVMMSKHGYREAIDNDITTKGQPIINIDKDIAEKYVSHAQPKKDL